MNEQVSYVRRPRAVDIVNKCEGNIVRKYTVCDNNYLVVHKYENLNWVWLHTYVQLNNREEIDNMIEEDWQKTLSLSL